MRSSFIICVVLAVLGGCAQTAPIRYIWPVEDHVFGRAAVAADHPLASRAGVEMLQLGGNAVDAAVATSFALSVVRPYSCGIGGGGFMVIYDPASGQSITLNYRETSPASVGPLHYVKLRENHDLDDAARWGVHASGVPGTVAGLLYALETYGTLDRGTVLAPAIRIAEQGFTADASFVSAIRDARRRIEANETIAGDSGHLRAFIGNRSEIEVGDSLRNPEQAHALRLIARDGAQAFYRGQIADAIVALMQRRGGPVTRDDLARYMPVERAPIEMTFGNHTVLAMPPPSSGGIAMAQVFGMLEARAAEVRRLAHNSPAYVHFIVEAMKHAFADRAEWLADDAYADVPTDSLLDEAYLDRLAWSIDLTRTMPPDRYGSRAPPGDDAGTSHLSVIDADGMAVACTETINYGFGSMVVVPGFGFMLNNEMDDFTTIPGEANLYGLTQSDRNLPEPGKRPLSSMSPTIVLDAGGRVIAVAGGSGGPRIISGTFQCLLNAIEYGMTAGEAVSSPRFHHQWLPNTLSLENRWADRSDGLDLRRSLTSFGHDVATRADVGVVQLIIVDADGVIHAASDPRKGGKPAGF